MDSIFSSWEKIAALAAMGGALAATWVVMRQSLNGYRLLRRFHAGDKRGRRRSVVATLLGIFLRRPRSMLSRENPFFDLVRAFTEQEIFNERPVRRWPLPDDDDDYGKRGFSLDFRRKSDAQIKEIRKEAYSNTRKKHDEELGEWRDSMRKLLDEPCIKLRSAGQLNDSLSRIKHYFDTLKTLDLDARDRLQFVCDVEIGTGYLASQHLLAGLLVRFNEKWGDIISGFEVHTIDPAGLRLGPRKSRDFREIQSFIYHCWLLWGPSIPVCGHRCHGWEGEFATCQYGYGDENNSIEIVGEHALLRTLISALPRIGAPMAIAASVKGQLQYSSIAVLDERRIPFTLRKSWEGSQDERPILFISSENTSRYGERSEGDPYRNSGHIRAEEASGGPNRSRYYSAYLWIMFIVLRRQDGEWVPLHPEDAAEPGLKLGSKAPWKSAIPFFEHANLADPETCAFSKQQLAEKAVSGLGNLASMFPAGDTPHRFAYACAIDDANCGEGLAFDELKGGATIRELIEARLAALPASAPENQLIDWVHFQPAVGESNPHSACAQTDWIRLHYAELDRMSAEAEAAEEAAAA